MTPPDFPSFIPHPLFRGGHAQTIAGVYLPGRKIAYRAKRHFVALGDGDRIVLHDDQPGDWAAGGPAALLIHGLGGCHGSPYVVRIAEKLCRRGVRVFRMDLRGWGAGARLAKLPFHAARTGDIRAALECIERACPGSPLTLVGFSLGGNMVLKLLGELDDAIVQQAMAIAPPIDLMHCCRNLDSGFGRLYDRNYAGFLWNHLRQRAAVVPLFAAAVGQRRPLTIYEFDARFTAPLGGFDSVEHYYATASAKDVLRHIRVPTLILSAQDDPIVPGEVLKAASLSDCVTLHLTDCGGHLGYIAARNGEPDRRWMDWRVVDFVTAANSLPRSHGGMAR